MNLHNTHQAAWPAKQLCEQYLPNQLDVYKTLFKKCKTASLHCCICSLQVVLQGDDGNSLLEYDAEQWYCKGGMVGMMISC